MSQEAREAWERVWGSRKKTTDYRAPRSQPWTDIFISEEFESKVESNSLIAKGQAEDWLKSKVNESLGKDLNTCVRVWITPAKNEPC
jgi:hypothetical protein